MSEIYPETPIGSPATPSRPLRDRIGIQPAISLSGGQGERDHLREERDTLASRNIFLADQLDQRDAHIATLSQQLADVRILAARLAAELDGLRAQPAPEPEASYAVVEAMGHRTLIGRVTEVTIAGKAMLRVDRIDGRSQTLPPESVYMLSPCTQGEAEAAAKRIYHGSGLPPALPGGRSDTWAAVEDEDSDGDEGGPF